MTARALLSELFDAAIAALDPTALVAGVLRRDGETLIVRGSRRRRGGRERRISLERGVLVVGAGTGAASLALAVEAVLGAAVVDGVVIVPRGYDRIRGARRRPRRFALARGGHPLPDHASVAATSRLLACLERHPDVPVIVVLTGGASSLLVKPAPGLTLADKQRATRLLLASGADIGEVNTVRKHLSAVKGGGLGAMLRGRRIVTLIVSDVAGDDLGTIGSGPTVADPTTHADAYAILEAYDLIARIPVAVRRHLERGMRGLVADTPERIARGSVDTILLASNATARAGVLRAARARGLTATIEVRRPITGETGRAAAAVARRIVAVQRARVRGRSPALVVAGGETTVTLGRRAGRGGRNQELALAVASILDRRPGWALLSAGTDGIDGPTPAAGAFADGDSLGRAERGRDGSRRRPAGSLRAGGAVAEALRRHDVFPLLASTGDLFGPGPTGTNVADLILALVWNAPAPGR